MDPQGKGKLADVSRRDQPPKATDGSPPLAADDARHNQTTARLEQRLDELKATARDLHHANPGAAARAHPELSVPTPTLVQAPPVPAREQLEAILGRLSQLMQSRSARAQKEASAISDRLLQLAQAPSGLGKEKAKLIRDRISQILQEAVPSVERPSFFSPPSRATRSTRRLQAHNTSAPTSFSPPSSSFDFSFPRASAPEKTATEASGKATPRSRTSDLGPGGPSNRAAPRVASSARRGDRARPLRVRTRPQKDEEEASSDSDTMVGKKSGKALLREEGMLLHVHDRGVS